MANYFYVPHACGDCKVALCGRISSGFCLQFAGGFELCAHQDGEMFYLFDKTSRQLLSYLISFSFQAIAQNKIEMIGNQLVLISLIEGSDPRIYQATFFDHQKVVFYNEMYANPSRVTYTLFPDRFERMIGGMENDQPSRYTFSFNKTN